MAIECWGLSFHFSVSRQDICATLFFPQFTAQVALAVSSTTGACLVSYLLKHINQSVLLCAER